jgi:hypothetical protein
LSKIDLHIVSWGYLCERDNSDKAEREPERSIPVELVRDDAQRHEEEE